MSGRRCTSTKRACKFITTDEDDDLRTLRRLIGSDVRATQGENIKLSIRDVDANVSQSIDASQASKQSNIAFSRTKTSANQLISSSCMVAAQMVEH